MRPIQLAHCGAFDRLSFGDVLASLIIEDALGQRLGNVTLTRYAPSARSVISWPYDVRSLDEFERDVPALSGLLVGNLETLIFSSDPSQPPHGHIHACAGNWLAPALAGLTSGLPVCWNSAAVRGIPEWGRPFLTFALSLSHYVSARDEDVVTTFRRAGFTGDSPIVPSVLFDVPRLIPGRDKGFRRPENIERWLRAANATGDYVVVQDHEDTRALFPALQKALAARGMTAVWLPVPAPANDAVTVIDDGPARSAGVPPLSPDTIAALIGHSAGVVAQDEGVITTALAYGLPVLLPSSGAQPAANGFTAAEVVTSPPSDPVPDAFVKRLGSFMLCARARNATSILNVHWNSLAARFGQGRGHARAGIQMPYLAWNRMLIASQEQADHIATALASQPSTARADTEGQLRAELERVQSTVIEARAQYQVEADQHQAWRAIAEQRRAEIDMGRQRLQEMKHGFDAAIDAMTREHAALKDEFATMLETLRQQEANLRSRKDEIEHLRSSFSWRLTGPLRSAKDAWRMRQR